jgi:hypothetical protein
MKKILLLLLLTISTQLFAEIIIVSEKWNKNKTQRIIFSDTEVIITTESDKMFGSDDIVKVSFEKYLTHACTGREYKVITANFGGKGRDSIVIDCINETDMDRAIKYTKKLTAEAIKEIDSIEDKQYFQKFIKEIDGIEQKVTDYRQKLNTKD